jgi:hypothetical protein
LKLEFLIPHPFAMNKRIIAAHYNQVKHELLEQIATQKEPDPESEILAYLGQDGESPESQTRRSRKQQRFRERRDSRVVTGG